MEFKKIAARNFGHTTVSFEVAIFDAQIFSYSILLCKKGLCIENGAIFAFFDISLAIKR